MDNVQQNIKFETSHLESNLLRLSSSKTISNLIINGEDVFTLSSKSYHDFLSQFLPDTRFIMEPKILGTGISLFYNKGTLDRAMNRKYEEISHMTQLVSNLPKRIDLGKDICIGGQLYSSASKFEFFEDLDHKNLLPKSSNMNGLSFCGFQIFNSKLNHFRNLNELKKLGFETPEIEIINSIKDINFYMKLWNEGQIFENYNTDGVVLK